MNWWGINERVKGEAGGQTENDSNEINLDQYD